MRIPSYPKVLALGHAEITDLLDGVVTIQEKYDGSQLSWAWDDTGLHVRSKGKVQYGISPDGDVASTDALFQGAVDYLLTVFPYYGYIFRGEWFEKPKHNTIAYSRRPLNGLILYDVEYIAQPQRFSHVDNFADALGVEAARTFATDVYGTSVTLPLLDDLLTYESTLGGHKIEGVVIKNYDRFTRDGKIMVGKYVSPEFKEKHGADWKGRNPNNSDVVATITDALNVEARWQKAVQHLRDDGVLLGTPADIGPLMKAVKQDVVVEEYDWITKELVNHFLPQVMRGVGRGLPEWYKARLASEALSQ